MALLAGVLSACGGDDTRPPVESPGSDKQVSTKVLETGADALQSRAPLNELNTYLDGFHFYSGTQASQMEAHHYCSILNEEVIQCVIYDGNVKDAHLMGVEYIISAKLFEGLPAEEKAYWHSHSHEVTSGQLIAPGMPQAAEHALMNKLVNTYGKTWHTWHTDKDRRLPLGVPQLMMGFTADGQADPQMIKDRDARMGVDSEQKRESRKDITPEPVLPGANAWMQGKVIQIPDPTGAALHHHPATPAQSEEGGTNSRSSAP
ncbi:OBAP family protein [Pseudomonas sp. CDFA 602]|uniref:OBAP family protein n=1 Tax=Pseudomonas californiensis TaxID=2829823 RepID=UPI001E498575|nr:OBAP family protein [Pseudomonas californiensis]MCD5994058.1 OBAP family protein [Pseudomonas californiensis]MCD5999843.1 OBAP family protein [Pseudomonas californiensis]